MGKIRKKRRRKKIAGRNNGPARQTYWRTKRLEERKIRHLMKYCGLSHNEAYILWHDTRKGRKK